MTENELMQCELDHWRTAYPATPEFAAWVAKMEAAGWVWSPGYRWTNGLTEIQAQGFWLCDRVPFERE